jgi:methyl-accepting chemotaxis protein
MNWFMNRRIGTKLVLTVSSVLVSSLLIGVVSIDRLSLLNSKAEDLGTNEMMGTRAIEGLDLALSAYRRWELRLVLANGDSEAIATAQDGLKTTIDNFKNAQAQYEPWIDNAEEKKLYDKACESWADYLTASAHIQEELRTRNHAEALAYLNNQSFDKFNAASSAIRADVDFQKSMSDESVKMARQAYSSARIFIVVLIVASIAIGLMLAFLMARLIVRPLHEVVDSAKRIAQGDLTGSAVTIHSQDEVGELGQNINTMHANLRQMIEAIVDNAEHVASASAELSATDQQISANSEETSAQAHVVSESAQKVSHNLQGLSAGAEQMSTTIQSIASNTNEAATIASKGVQTAQSANANVSKLGESSAEIGEVIEVITSIAEQTNLLALNATIEAARAGEAGKGFAVVANEVKELAKQTAKATEDIGRKITAIQVDTKGAVEAIGSISSIITQVNDISGTIATAVEEQSATTREMTRNVSEAAKGSDEITTNIAGVADAARGTANNAHESQKAAEDLSQMASQLRGLVEQFKIDRKTSAAPVTPGRKAMTTAAGR